MLFDTLIYATQGYKIKNCHNVFSVVIAKKNERKKRREKKKRKTAFSQLI